MLKTLFVVLLLPDGDPIRQLSDKDPDRRVQAIEALRAAKADRLPHLLLPLLADDHPKVRLRAAEALRSVPSSDLLRQTGLRHPHPRVRAGSCELLGLMADPSALPLLAERLSDAPPVQAAAAQALGRLRSPEAVSPLLAAFRREPDWPLRAHALEALDRLQAAADLHPAAAQDRHYQVRLVAAEILPTPALVADRDWRVRVSAFEACRRLRLPDSVGWLIDQMGREEGRPRWDLRTALVDLAARDLGPDPRPWKTWWEANRDTFTPPPVGNGNLASPSGTRASFFSVPIVSTRLLFVLDLSGSMREPSPEGGTKLDAAKKGMLETIRALPPETRFGIVGLGCDEEGRYADRERKTWQRRPVLVPASPAARADAERFVRSLEAKGWTNLYDGLEFAFSEPDVDTIYLYSDGGASKGTFVAASEILSQLAGLNRFRKVMIHTVEVPGARNPEDNRRLLSRLASSTGGTSRLFEGK